jgi:hypothetical protein
MTRPKLRSPDQPLPVRFILGLYEFAASLKLAVILIFALAAVLAWATFVEMDYGLSTVHFALYNTWWFGLLGALLAINIFCAAVIRYPWKRYQTGFVVTHLGLLTLLFGCLLSRRGGIDAQMSIFEGETNHRAYTDDSRIELAIERHSPRSDAQDDEIEVISIPFHGGPMNWRDLDRLRRPPTVNDWKVEGKIALSKLILSLPNWVAWNLASIDRGIIYDRDGIRVEALDYYSNSEEISAPRLRLDMTMPRMTQMGDDGRTAEGPERWVPVELAVNSAQHGPVPRRLGFGDRKNVGGGNLVFWIADGERDLKAFLDSQPDKQLGLDGKGQLVLHVDGKRIALRVEEKAGQGSFLLGDTGLTADLTYFANAVPNPVGGELQLIDDPQGASNPAVVLKLVRGEEAPRSMVLFAELPELNAQSPELGVFGTFWVDAGKKSSEQLLAGQGGSRIDIVQSPDHKLYYRYWNRHEVVAAGELPLDGTEVDAFKMPIAQLKMRVSRFVPAPEPSKVIEPVAFRNDGRAQSSFRAVELRVTVDGNTEQFWLLGPPPMPFDASSFARSKQVVDGKDRRVTFRFPLKQVDVGFLIRLDNFERKLDPGTSQPSHYSSTVDFLDPESFKPVLTDVFITMNAPVDFSDPRNGRSYRLFQESFVPPLRAGQPFGSVLTVNYDPGRGVKYAGCLLIVAGIVTMFYMRAYFFKAKSPPPTKQRRRELMQV